MFYDLNLPVDDDSDVSLQRERVCGLVTLGYGACAAACSVSGRIEETHRCAVSPIEKDSLQAAGQNVRRALARQAQGLFRQPEHGIQQLTRLAFSPADPVEAQTLPSRDSVARSYDLVSITPRNERVLHQACSSLEVDIICLDLTSRMPFKLRPATLSAALKRGIYFEITYAAALREVTARRNLFCNAQMLVRATRGKNILISSGARNAFELRGPADVQQLGSLFGLTLEQAREAISSAPAAVMERARRRRMYNGAVGLSIERPMGGGDAMEVDGGGEGQQQAGQQLQQQQQQAGRKAAGGGAPGGKRKTPGT